MSFRWSEETTYKFVSKYLENECLWNIKSPQYKNKQIKESAYLDIEKSMNVPGFGEKEIKIKIKNIRSTYSQEIKKIKDSKSSGAGTDTVYIPSVKWFSLLNASLQNLTSTLTESESNLASTSSHTVNTDTEQNSANTDTEQNSANTDTEQNSASGDTFHPPPKRKKLAQLSSMVNQLKQITDGTNSTVDENEFDVFGKHVGIQLRSLPVLLALQAQEHIQLYINRIRRQHLQNASESNPGTPQSPYVTESPLSNYNDHQYYYNLAEETNESNTSSILPTNYSEHSVDIQPSSNNETNSGVRIISHDLIFAAMQNADVNNESIG